MPSMGLREKRKSSPERKYTLKTPKGSGWMMINWLPRMKPYVGEGV